MTNAPGSTSTGGPLDDCLETRLGATLAALARLRWPAVVCLQVMLVSHVVWALRGSHGVPWVAPLAGVLGLAWLGIGVVIARRLLPTVIQPGGEYLTKLARVVLALEPPRRWGAVAVVSLGLVVMGAPWWPALVLSSALAWLVVLWVNNAKEGLVFVGILSVVGAVAAGVLTTTGQTGWISPLLGVVLAVSLLLFVVSLHGFGHFVIPLVVGLVAGTERLGEGTGALVLAFLLLYPALLLVLALFGYKTAADQMQALVDQGGLRDTLGRESSGPREDEVRESDGFYRVCYPQYRHWSPEVAGEAGYITWLGGAHDRRVPFDGALIRTTSMRRMPLAYSDDVKGRALAEAVLEGLQTLQVQGVDQAREALSRGWVISRSRPQEEALAKMPWDHPYLLAIPVEWIGRFRYPPGSGVHDRDGYPCHARSVTVRIALAPQLVPNLTRLSANGGVAADTTETRACRQLLWNAPRILPGLYETLLTRLVAEFRGESIALFLEHEVARDEREAKENLLLRLRQALPSAMPRPLGELVTCDVLDIEMYPSVAGDVEDLINRLRSVESSKPFARVEIVEKLLDQTRAWALRQQFDVEDEADVRLRELLAEFVSTARDNVSKAANVASNDMNKLLAGSLQANALPQVQRKVDERMEEFHGDIDRHFTNIQEALNTLTAVTRQTASSATSGQSG